MVYKKEATLWAGKIGTPEKYVKEAIKNKEDLVLSHNGERMKVLYKDINRSITGYSLKYFKDRYSGGNYRLAYFTWKPPTEEEKLIAFSKQSL